MPKTTDQLLSLKNLCRDLHSDVGLTHVKLGLLRPSNWPIVQLLCKRCIISIIYKTKQASNLLIYYYVFYAYLNI